MVSGSGDMDYSLADIDINLHYFNSKGTENSGQLSKGKKDNRIKWNSVKSFERIFSAYSGGEWEIWLTLTTRGQVENLGYTQDYALVITIEDVTPDISQRINLRQIIKNNHKNYSLLTVKTQAQVQAK